MRSSFYNWNFTVKHYEGNLQSVFAVKVRSFFYLHNGFLWSFCWDFREIKHIIIIKWLVQRNKTEKSQSQISSKFTYENNQVKGLRLSLWLFDQNFWNANGIYTATAPPRDPAARPPLEITRTNTNQTGFSCVRCIKHKNRNSVLCVCVFEIEKERERWESFWEVGFLLLFLKL